MSKSRRVVRNYFGKTYGVEMGKNKEMLIILKKIKLIGWFVGNLGNVDNEKKAI